MVAVERELSETPAPASLTTADAIPLALRRRGGTPRQVLALTVVGVLALALFASRDLPSWTERLGDGPVAERLQALATEWDRAMERLGLVEPHEAVDGIDGGAAHRIDHRSLVTGQPVEQARLSDVLPADERHPARPAGRGDLARRLRQGVEHRVEQVAAAPPVQRADRVRLTEAQRP